MHAGLGMHELVGDHSPKGPDKTTTASSCFRKRWDHANKRTVPFQEQSCTHRSVELSSTQRVVREEKPVAN
jgi:hypothetical protein